MLTPQEINDAKFDKAVFGGYDMAGVDDFIAAIGNDYAALYKENAILKGKLKVLVEKVEEYRSTEDAMRMALVTAQRTGDEITSEAVKAKEDMLKKTDIEAKKMLEEVAKRVAAEELRLNVAAKETAKFIEVSQLILKKHSEFLSKLETARRVVEPKAEAVAPPQPSREEQITAVAGHIGNVMDRITGVTIPADTAAPPADEQTAQAAPPQQQSIYDDESEPTIQYKIEDDDEPVTPRPKFAFEDLKFGKNFNAED